MPAVFFTTLAAWAGWELLGSPRDRAHAHPPAALVQIHHPPSSTLDVGCSMILIRPRAPLPLSAGHHPDGGGGSSTFPSRERFSRKDPGSPSSGRSLHLWVLVEGSALFPDDEVHPRLVGDRCHRRSVVRAGLIQTKGALYSIFIQQQVIDRSLQVSQGHGASSILGYVATLPFYFVLAFATFFPWSFWFPEAFRRFRKSAPRRKSISSLRFW